MKFFAVAFSRQSTSQTSRTHVRQDLNTAFGATFNSKIIAKMHRNVKNMALNTAKRTPVYSKMLKYAALHAESMPVMQLKFFRPFAEVREWSYK